ncbi:MAG: hypothetical protein FJY80_08565, partial [Candidatus Aminicenantes bacterium]|nr:hypothetical protein [Candidatus Aminicenantes bacterium]
MKKALEPRDWGLQSDAEGRLMVGPFRAVELAREFGTPLHVLNVPRLERAARDFIDSVRSAYPGPSSVHYAFKCNALPAVVEAVRRAGLGAEVMSEFELDLAFRLGYRGRDIVVNGPGKPAGFLKKCLAGGARLINLDSLDELTLLQDLARAERRTADVLVRVNPNVVPRRTNAGSATGSRRGCAFGLDLEGGEVRIALSALKKADRLRFRGFSFHIGTGIRDPQEYARAVRRLRPLIRESRAEGFRVEILDVGGGFAAPTTRELATREL